MESMLKIAGVVMLAYVVLVAGCTVVQRSLMYFPDSTLPDPAAVGLPQMRVVMLATDDGLSLTSWYAAAGAGRPTIVYFQGNGGNIAHRAFKVRPFLEAGYGLLLVGYRGYGGNPGKPTEAGLFADGRAAMDFLAAHQVPAERVVLLGESLGTGVAVYLAGEYAVAALVLEAPFTSAADVGQAAYPILPVQWLIYDRYDSLARIGAVSAPLLVVHGERDGVVPVRFGKRLYAAANEPKQAHFLPSAGHNDMTEHGLIDLELAFLEDLQPR